MAKAKELCCCEMKALRAELERRARGKAGSAARALGIGRGGPLATATSRDIVGALRDRQRAIYGTDDRQDIYEVRDPALRRVVDGVVALVEKPALRRAAATGKVQLRTTSYRDDYELCDSEPFVDQPLGCFCTGFLVAPDIIATAGHCVRSNRALANVRFVFGFHMLSATRARTVFSTNDVYQGAELIAREEADPGADWALIRLARPVVGRAPLPVRTTGKIADKRSLFVVGHPNGLPAKLAGGARVRSNNRRAFFVANLDTYGGNSGSPVFDARTRVVEGILVRGEDDFVSTGDCHVSLVCPDMSCRGEDVTRSTLWADRLAEA